MKSIKRGRGPSFMSGVGSLAAVVFGLIWTIAAWNMTRSAQPVFDDTMGLMGDIFPLFGVIFIIVGLISAVYNFINATQSKRFSEFDITTGGEEEDPLNQRFGERHEQVFAHPDAKGGARFCPYCGEPARDGFVYCARCGKQLPTVMDWNGCDAENQKDTADE